MSRLLIVTYNVRRSIFELGLKSFYPLNKFRIRNGSKVAILPVVTNLGDNIEFRSKELSRLVPNLVRENNCQTCDLVSFSLSGVDARLALTHFGLSKYVKSLITVGSPHQGSKMAWLSERQVFSDRKSEPISRLLGVGMRPFWEVAPDSMKNFNRDVKDVENVNYFSIGAEKMPKFMNKNLQPFGNYLRTITEQNYVYENDGVFGHDECLWGDHLVNFEADHSELVGINYFRDLDLMLSLISDTTDSLERATTA